jgi:RNA-directed DNA polymerase
MIKVINCVRGVLSPLLSNILLHELDKTLDKRGHRYVRYADDCSIYVRSEKSAQRVMESMTRYVEAKLKLKVNRDKSKISRPHRSSLLGISFYRGKTGWEMRISSKSLFRIKQKIKGITQRNAAIAIGKRIEKLETMLRGWVNYFILSNAKKHMLSLDEMIRIRLRMILWKSWKKPGARMKHLIALGIERGKAYEWSNSRKGYCRIAHSPILCRALNNAYFTKLKYTGFANYYYWKTTHQMKLF